jgi:hypothetical protein
METEVKTNNELIAEFMGAERREGPRAFNPDQILVQWIIKGNPYNQHRDDIKYWYQPVELKYHESWDWLMPVVEKIGNVWDLNEIGTEAEKVLRLPLSTHIQEVNKAVVKFINFYNEHLNQTKPNHDTQVHI